MKEQSKMKKGQNAIEFLVTYGWMILIVGAILVAFLAVNYISSGKLIPDSCSFSSGFECTDFKVTTGAAVISLENGFGEDINIDSLTLRMADGSECLLPVSDVNMYNGETKSFDIQGCSNGEIDERYNGNIKVQYTIGGSKFTQIGELTTRVEGVSTTTSSSTSVTTTSSTTSLVATTSSSTTTTTSTTTSIGVQYIKTLKPTVAYDNLLYDQISPDSGSLDGTVDLSNNDVRWLTVTGDYIEVTSWNMTLPSATIMNLTATCEVDFVNNKKGDLSFLTNTGSGWSELLCRQFVTIGGNYLCDLYTNGIDTYSEINNLDLRCRMNSTDGSTIGFSVDYIKLRVGYAA